MLQKSRDEIIDNYGILKCDIDYFSNIDKKDIIVYKKTKYAYEILVSNKEQASKKYNGCVIDRITLEDLMVLVIKGKRYVWINKKDFLLIKANLKSMMIIFIVYLILAFQGTLMLHL